MKPEVWGILVAAGSGTRFGDTHNKLLYLLKGQTVLAHSMAALQRINQLSGIVLVYHPDGLADYQAALSEMFYPLIWAKGGATRRQSVWNGLQALPDSADIVLIHDAARPLVQPAPIEAALTLVLQGDCVAASLGCPVVHTIKQIRDPDEASPWVLQTLHRDRLWQVHTPQIFKKDVLQAAHQAIPHDAAIYDDAALVEQYLLKSGHSSGVRMVLDAPSNLKMTTPWDVTLAETWLAAFQDATVL